MKKSCVLMLAALFLTGFGRAKEPCEKKAIRQFPVEISFIAHSITMPFDGIILRPLHPGVTIGTEYCYSEGKIGRLFQSLHCGYFDHEFSAKALFVQSGLGYRYTLRIGIFADAEVGLGYIHSFHPTDIFAQNAQGEYERVKDNGKPGLLMSLYFGVGYDFSQKIRWPVSLFFRFQPFLQTPYSPEVSIFPQAFVHLGLRIQL